MEEEIINRVSKSSLINIDIEEIYPKDNEIMVLDMIELIDDEILREEKFRKNIKEKNWEIFRENYVAIQRVENMIIPIWAYMLVTINIKRVGGLMFFGDKENVKRYVYLNKLEKIYFKIFQDKQVIIKGCTKISDPEFALIEYTNRLEPYAKSIMFGEACSSVPIFKKK